MLSALLTLSIISVSSAQEISNEKIGQMTKEVCTLMSSSYKDMGTPVATLRPFETGAEYAVLTVGGKSWNVHYLIEDESVHFGNPWNTFDAAPFKVDVYVSRASRMNKYDECVIQYRRQRWAGIHLTEVGRVNVGLVVVEPVSK